MSSVNQTKWNHHKGKNKQSATTKGAAIVGISNPTETKFGKWKMIHKSKNYYNPEMTTPVSDITKTKIELTLKDISPRIQMVYHLIGSISIWAFMLMGDSGQKYQNWPDLLLVTDS